MAFQVLSRLPGGEPLYHSFQRNFTKSTLQTEGRLSGKIEQTLTYWNWLQKNTPPGWLAGASHLDLGTGWLPSVPITLYSLGINRQYLVDIMPHMQPAAVVETVELFRKVAPKTKANFARLPEVPARGKSLQATLEPFGMTYAAPYDELAAKINGTVGFATGTHMLLHLNRPTLLMVFKTIHKLLKPGGYFMAQQHLRQLFDGLEARTSPFYGLKYSDWTWERLICSPMMSYNRLKAPDYREVLLEAGFEIAHFEIEPGTPEDLALLDKARIHPMFKKFTREELAARQLFFAARKP